MSWHEQWLSQISLRCLFLNTGCLVCSERVCVCEVFAWLVCPNVTITAQTSRTPGTGRKHRKHTKGRNRAYTAFGTAFPGIWTRVLLHSNLGSLSLAVVVSPGTEQQKGTSTEHTSEHSVWLLREASGFAYTQLGFFRNHSCISGERLCDSE